MKKRYDKIGELYRLRAFPKTSNGGNKAGVFINGYNLTETDMQTIAKRVNYSETAFVLKSDSADFKVRFFTPNSEVDLCGHATIATFNLLRDLKIISPGIYTQETKAGILKLDVRNDFVFMEQPAPRFYDLVDNDLIRKCFKKIDFDVRFKPQIVSTGIKEIFIAVKSVEELNALITDFGAISTLARTYSAIGIHVFALGEDADAYGRNFAPVVGIDEESATGTSNGALACYLYKYWKKKNNYVLRQGYSMNQPSEIIVNLEIENESVTKVHVGGSAIIINQ
jgi:PhzF family phenazine biosynthesis protein